MVGQYLFNSRSIGSFRWFTIEKENTISILQKISTFEKWAIRLLSTCSTSRSSWKVVNKANCILFERNSCTSRSDNNKRVIAFLCSIGKRYHLLVKISRDLGDYDNTTAYRDINSTEKRFTWFYDRCIHCFRQLKRQVIAIAFFKTE